MGGLEIFHKYINEIAEIYEKSVLKKDSRTSNWSYSLCSTPLFVKSIVLCGLNWGADGNHSPQSEYPTVNFMGNDELGSLARVKEYLCKYLQTEELSKIVQINACFFRTKKEADLSQSDLELNKSVFLELLKDLQPKLLIGMSAKIFPLIEHCLIKHESTSIKSRSRSLTIYKGTFSEIYGGGSFLSIPHPNSPISKQARVSCWEYFFHESKA